MGDYEDKVCTNTFSDTILVEFIDTASRNLDEAKLEPRYGRPSPEILAERAREAARFLAELEKIASKNKEAKKPLSNDDEKGKE